MKNFTILTGLAMVCVTVILVSMQQPVRAARASVNLGGATFTDLPLVDSHSFGFTVNAPMEQSVLGFSVRAVESQMPTDAGLVLTHVSSRSPISSEADYYIFIDGSLVFSGGRNYGTANLMMQQMSPILVRPGRLLRIEFRVPGGGEPLVNVQGYAVSNAALFQ